MTNTLTLSQNLDAEDFIAPDILDSVDAGVRAAAEDILGQGGLAAGFEGIFGMQTAAPVLPDAGFVSGAPPMDHDGFMPYEPPVAPDVAIPDIEHIQVGPEPGHESIVVEMPDVDPVNADMLKVQMDTRRFDKDFHANARVYVFIAAIAVAVAVLTFYLFSIF